MTDEQRALLDKARRALATAQATLDLGDVEAAVNRAYYAPHHAASVALLSEGESRKTHSGVHNRFYIHFVASGRISRFTGLILGDAYDLRQQADYDVFTTFDGPAASDLISDAERFVDAVENMLAMS